MDPFELLGLPRRPLLSDEEIGSAYRKLAGKLHPDQEGGDARAFLALGKATAILRDPSRRLRELTGGATEDQLPPQAAEFFAEVASILQQADTLVAQEAAASHALAKALLAAPLKAFRPKLEHTFWQIQAWRTALDDELGRIDRQWPEDDPAAMNLLADSYTYVQRWEGQLRERKLDLDSICG